MITFETKVYENDWRYILKTNYLDLMIDRCNYPFLKKILYINNVNDINQVKKYAQKKIDKGIIDEYIVVADYADEALAHFNITKESFKGGYYYSIAELVSIYLCKTPYLIHFSSDAYLEKNNEPWIEEAILLFEKYDNIVVANATWDYNYEEAKGTEGLEFGNFYASHGGFSDQNYLIKTALFKQSIYNEYHPESEKYPVYGGELFEKRVDSYLRNHNLIRLNSKKVSYIHRNFPRSKAKKMAFNVISLLKLNQLFMKYYR